MITDSGYFAAGVTEAFPDATPAVQLPARPVLRNEPASSTKLFAPFSALSATFGANCSVGFGASSADVRGGGRRRGRPRSSAAVIATSAAIGNASRRAAGYDGTCWNGERSWIQCDRSRSWPNIPITKHTASSAHDNAVARGASPISATENAASSQTAGANASAATIASPIAPASSRDRGVGHAEGRAEQQHDAERAAERDHEVAPRAPHRERRESRGSARRASPVSSLRIRSADWIAKPAATSARMRNDIARYCSASVPCPSRRDDVGERLVVLDEVVDRAR